MDLSNGFDNLWYVALFPYYMQLCVVMYDGLETISREIMQKRKKLFESKISELLYIFYGWGMAIFWTNNTWWVCFIDIGEKYKIMPLRGYNHATKKKNTRGCDWGINSRQTQTYSTNSGRSDWDIDISQCNSLRDESNKSEAYPHHPPNINTHAVAVHFQNWAHLGRSRLVIGGKVPK